MGAGSKRMSQSERNQWLNLGKDEGSSCKSSCFSRFTVKGMSNLHFLNTLRPYRVEECTDCKGQFVVEL